MVSLGLGSSLSKASVVPAPSLFIEKFSATAPIVAFSLRKLGTYSDNKACRVRRSSDNVEAEVLFDSNNAVSDSSGLAQVSASFSETNLGDFVGSGDAFISTFYDQAGGSSEDAAQTNVNYQPKLYSSGSLITSEGKAAIEFDGTDDYLPIASSFNDSLILNSLSSSVVYQAANTTQQGILLFLGGSSGSNKRWYQPFINTTTTWYSYNGHHPASSETSNTDQNLLTYIAGSEDPHDGFRAYRNGVAKGTELTTASDNSNATDTAGIGSYSQGSLKYAGKFQEAIVFDTDRSSNRTEIEEDIATYYNITLP